MSTGIAFFFTVAVFTALIATFVGLFLRYQGKRIVTCPETKLPVGLEISAAKAAGTWIVSQPRFVVTACSRWPERAGCDQACAPQVEASPNETLVRTIVAKWYAARTCAYCTNPIGEISGSAVLPALLSPDGQLREWSEVAAEELPQILANAVAVCARCELAEDFRRRFPNRLIDRPATPPRRRIVVDASQAVY